MYVIFTDSMLESSRKGKNLVLKDNVMKISALLLASALAFTAPATPPNDKAAKPAAPQASSTVAGVSQNTELKWQGRIYNGFNGNKIQYVLLENGVAARLSYNESTGIFRAALTDGRTVKINLKQALKQAVNFSAAPGTNMATRALKTPNECQVASGIAGLAHSALWGTAVGVTFGNAPGAVAGAAIGAFWWFIGTQC